MFSTRVGFYKQTAQPSKTYVIVGDTGRVMSSTNGTTWITNRTQSGQTNYDIAYAYNLWIITGNDSTPTPFIITSSDLTTFTTQSNPSGSWSNHAGVSVATSGVDTSIVIRAEGGASVYYSWGSTNGTTWTSQSLSFPFGYQNPTYAKQTYFDSNFVMPGGRSNPPPNYSATYWYASGSTSSRTGQNITTNQNNTCTMIEKLTSTLYVAYVQGTTAGIRYSSNGTSWSTASTSITSRMNAAAYGAGLAVIVGINGEIWTSTNGNTWTSRTSGSVYDFYDIIWTGTQFIAVGDAGTIRTSSDGITWSSQTSGTTDGLRAITSN